jgi:uncharacterized protein YceK
LPEEEKPTPGYYSGVRGDLKLAPVLWKKEAPGGPAWTSVLRVYTVLYMVVDVPLSALADTAILPFEFLYRIFDGEPPEPQTVEE